MLGKQALTFHRLQAGQELIKLAFPPQLEILVGEKLACPVFWLLTTKRSGPMGQWGLL